MSATVPTSDAGALLEGVDRFVAHEVAGRSRPLTAADLAAVDRAAATSGLVSEVGLWTGSLPDPEALRHVARVDTAVAHDLHVRALGRCWLDLDDTALLVDGAIGLGGSCLGRWLTGHALPSDHDVLAALYGRRDRVGLVAPGIARLAAPVVVDGDAELQAWEQDALEGDVDPAAHGLDGLACRTWRPTGAATVRRPLAPEQWRTLLAQHLVARVAMATGAVERSGARAHAYAGLRVQGGRAIVGHDAVAELLADVDGGIALAAAWLSAVDTRDLPRVVAGARELLPRLAVSANAAVQVHGGSGYMRDTGVEDALRDVNTLRVMGGAPPELALLYAALGDPAAATPPDPHGPDALAGHVPMGSPLSPWQALGSIGLTRRLVSYRPTTPWEQDTHDLPAPIGRRRRETRRFADRTMRPVAAELDLALRDGGTMPEGARDVLVQAGRAGLLSDLLPVPLTLESLRRGLRSLVLNQAVRCEELARVDGGLMLLLSANGLGVAPILLSGDLRLAREVVLPAFAASRAGDPQVFGYAITEPDAGSDVEESHGAGSVRPGTVARRASGGWALHGRKVFISGGDIARWVVVFAALEGEGVASWTAFLVDTTSPGFEVVRTEHKMGMRASGAAELAFDGCFVPDDHVVGGPRRGWAINRATLNFSRIPVAAMAVGFAQHATEIATDYACHTLVAGEPLVHRQQVQLTIAELVAETRAIRALVWDSARAWTPTQARASIAKLDATDRAQHVVERAMDLLGTAAVPSAADLERVFRDVRLTRIFEGTNQINRLAIVEDLQPHLLARVHHHGATTP